MRFPTRDEINTMFEMACVRATEESAVGGILETIPTFTVELVPVLKEPDKIVGSTNFNETKEAILVPRFKVGDHYLGLIEETP